MKLKHRVQLQKKDTTQDSAGQTSVVWSTYRNCSALVTDTTAREQMQDGRQQALVMTRVYLKQPKSGRFPTANDRVVFRIGNTRTRTLNIEGVMDNENHTHLVLLTREDAD